MSYYVHHTPGRLRIRIPAIRNNPRKVDAVKTILDIRGTERVEVNPLTGSVVITYDAAVINSQELFNVLQHHGFYSEGRAITLDAQIQQASHKAARKVGRAFFGWAVGRVLEDSGLAFIAALI